MSKSTPEMPAPKSVIFTLEQMEGAEAQFDNFVIYRYKEYHSSFCDKLERRKRWLNAKAIILPIFLLLLLMTSALLVVLELVPRLPIDKAQMTAVAAFAVGAPLAFGCIWLIKIGDRWSNEYDMASAELRNEKSHGYPRLDILNRLNWKYYTDPTTTPPNEAGRHGAASFQQALAPSAKEK